MAAVEPQIAFSPQQQFARPPMYPSSGGTGTPSPPNFQIVHPTENSAQENNNNNMEENFGEFGLRVGQQRLSSSESPGFADHHYAVPPAPVSESGGSGSRSSGSPKPPGGPQLLQERRSTDGREQSPGIGFVVGGGSAAEKRRGRAYGGLAVGGGGRNFS